MTIMINQKHKYGVIKIFYFVQQQMLSFDKCLKSEVNKYSGVCKWFFTGILACFSGGYVFAFCSSCYLFLGILGLLSLSDRFSFNHKEIKGELLNCSNSTKTFWRSYCFSNICSLELKIFEQEINESIYYAGANKIDIIISF